MSSLGGRSPPGHRPPHGACTRITVTAVVLVVLSVNPVRGAAGQPEHKATPVVVMTMGDFLTESARNSHWIHAVRARLERVNRRRGIRDALGIRHQIELVPCNTGADPIQSTRCAQEAVDRDVVAVVGFSVVYSDAIWPILEAAAIPVIGTRVNTTADASIGVSFPIASGLAGTLPALAQVLARKGARDIAFVVSDYGSALTDVLAPLHAGLTSVRAVQGPILRVPLGTTDYAPVVQEVIDSRVSGVVGLLGDGPPGGLPLALREARFKGWYATQAPFGTAEVGSQPNDAMRKTLVVGQFARADSWRIGARDFRSDLRAAGRPIPDDEGALNYWLAARVFAGIAAGTNLDAPSILAALQGLRDYSTGELTVALDTTVRADPLPRLFNRTVTINEFLGGKLVTTRFFDPFTGQLIEP